MSLQRGALIGALCLFSVVARPSAQAPTVAWTLRVPDANGKSPFVQSVWNDHCAAVVTATAVHVVSMRGEIAWSWNYRRASSLLKPHLPNAPEPVALAPTCDRVAMAGDPGYRYVWVAGRDFQAKAFQTVGTPLAVAFDLSGDHLAISTGASRGYLLTRDLQPQWTGHLRDFPIRWPEQQLPELVRGGLIDFAKSAVDGLLGVPPWGLWISDSVSENGQWRVVADSPWARQDQWQMLVLYGPEGHAFHGRWNGFRQRVRPRWSKPMGCLSAEITPDGEFVIASGDPQHPDQSFFGRSEATCFQPEALTTFVFDRDGSAVFSHRGEISPADLAEAFRKQTGRSLPSRPEPYRYTQACELSTDGVIPLCFPGLNGVVITSRGNEIRAVRRSGD